MRLVFSLIFLLAFAVSANAADKDPILAMKFNTVCTVCTNGATLYPLESITHSGTTTNGGSILGVTLTFRCVRDKTPAQKKCRKTFRQEAQVFVAKAPLATPVDIAPAQDGSFRGGWSSAITNLFNAPK